MAWREALRSASRWRVGERSGTAYSRSRGDDREALGAAGLELGLSLALPGVPLLGVVAERMTRAVREELERASSTALRTAEEVAGCSREELAQEIATDPRLVPLVTRLLYAAGMNRHDSTLRAMGGAFGHAVRDRNQLDEAEITMTAIADLGEAHAHVLRLLVEAEPVTHGLSPSQLDERSDLSEKLTGLCVAALVARGLALRTQGPLGPPSITPTALGLSMVETLQRYADADSA